MTRRRFAMLLAATLAAAAFAQEPSPVVKGAALTILQINDVYETLPVNGRGGLARIATLKKQIADTGATPFVIIAGDFLSSSVASSVFKGKQMIEAFNAMGLDLATLGNHEFDFGKEVLLQRMAESNFQYIVANVLDEATGQPVGGAKSSIVKTFGDLKVGFLGLTIAGEGVSGERRRGLRFLNPIETAGPIVASLLAQHVNAIVAVTHLTIDEDRELVRRYPDISVVVGGHEHFPITTFVDRTLITKAGSDAKYVARVDVKRGAAGVERHFALIPIDAGLADEPRTAAVVAEWEAKLGAELDAPIGSSRVPLDADSRRIRSGETNLGDFVADAMRAHVSADIGLINSGSIRGDRIFQPGPISRRTVLTIHPFGNVLCKVAAPGHVIVGALNAGTEEWPDAAGRFPQVSGVTFALGRNRPAGHRVDEVRVGGQPIATDRQYTVAIPDYLLNGGDGYTMFGGLRVLVGPETGDSMAIVLERYIAAAREIAPQTAGRITAR